MRHTPQSLLDIGRRSADDRRGLRSADDAGRQSQDTIGRRSRDTMGRRSHDKDQGLRWVRRVGYGLLGIQLVVMLVAGARLYARWDVTNDFALYSQAWYLIAHGHLNPYSTVDQLPFWKNHFELIMWPMSLVYWIHSSPVDLKWLQELAAVASEAVAFRWVLDALGRHRRSIPAAPVALGFVVVLVVNPYFYQADWFDFHFQAFATLFLVLAARDLYNGRNRRALIWAAIMLLTGDVAATYAIGLGVAALVCSRETRRAGVVLVVGGVLWIVLISSLHANVGSDLQAGLGYLAAGSTVTIFSIVAGLFIHPGRWFLILHQRWHLIFNTLTTGGVVGIAAPWALFISIVVLVPNALQANVGYIRSPFQNFPVYIIVPVGTVLVLEWTARRGLLPFATGTGGEAGPASDLAAAERPRHRGIVVATCIVGVGLFGLSLYSSIPNLSTAKSDWFVNTSATAAALDAARAQIPPDAQVIVGSAVSGGLGERKAIYAWFAAPQVFPITQKPVYFVFAPKDPLQPVRGPISTTAIAYTSQLPGARVVFHRSGVTMVTWHPPPGVRSVTLPQPG
ncbi:MAG TPA: DUF2079 domain-containing protein [Acidimicrobiales bacterium]|nr:DUF2079 domain-containing protein [Acidimicrobiales bacterium]